MHQPKLRTLYKAILKLHRSLPQDLKELGDGYTKDEFRRHIKGATESQAKIFLREWSDYYATLAKQVGIKGGNSEFGKPLPPEKLEEFQDEQIHQLYDLKLSAGPPKQSSGSEQSGN